MSTHAIFRRKIRGRHIPGLALAAAFLLSCSEPDNSGCQTQSTANAQIEISSPNCGSHKVGSTLTVKWSLKGAGPQEITAVDVMVSHNDGQIWTNLRTGSIAPSDPDWGTFHWVVPDSLTRQGVRYNLVGNNQCRIKVEQYSTSNPDQVTVTGRFTVTR